MKTPTNSVPALYIGDARVYGHGHTTAAMHGMRALPPTTTTTTTTPVVLLRRCRFEAPFLPETFPEYTGHYPLFLANKETLRARETRHEDTDTATTTTTERVDHKHKAENSGRLSKSEVESSEPVPALTARPSCGDGKKKDKMDPMKGKRAKRISDAAAVVVGSLNLRICVTSTSTPPPVPTTAGDSDTADTAAVGDEDPPDMKRRSKNNAVTRRVRLRVRWVSLARLLNWRMPGSSCSGAETNTAVVEDTMTATTNTEKKQNAHHVGDSRCPVDGGGRSSQDRDPDREPKEGTTTGANQTTRKNRSSASQDGGPDPENSGTAGETTTARKRISSSTSPSVDQRSPVRLLPPTSSSSSTGVVGVVWCRVNWCGLPVDSFEICPRTGLPLTPGECLLSLPRGRPWRHCWLVLEIITIVTGEKNTRHQHAATTMRQTRGRSDDVARPTTHVQSDIGDGQTRGMGLRKETGEGFAVSSGESGEDQNHHCLGMAVIGWQVRPDGCFVVWSQRTDFGGGARPSSWCGSDQGCGRRKYPPFSWKGVYHPLLPLGAVPPPPPRFPL